MKCGGNWPEFKSCFGICSLKIGVYIIATVGLFFSTGALIGNCFIFQHLFQRRDDILFNEDSPYFNNITDERLQTLVIWTNIGFAYYIVWICLKFVMIMTTIILFYGVWKNKPQCLKIYLYINVPYWVLTVINALMATYFFSLIYNLIAVVTILIDCCLMLVVRSAYREMTGKRRFLGSTSDTNNEESVDITYRNFENPPEYEPESTNNNIPHCPTCTCALNNESDGGQERVTESTLVSSTTENVYLVSEASSAFEETIAPKELNLKEMDIIFDQDRLATCSSSVIESPRIDRPIKRERFVQSTNLESRRLTEDPVNEEKKNIDVPVIYDQNQLIIGMSPLFEDLPDINKNGLIASNSAVIQKEIRSQKIQDAFLESVNVNCNVKREVFKNKEKKNIDEFPVIYDHNQLNIGTSPLFEDLPDINRYFPNSTTMNKELQSHIVQNDIVESVNVNYSVTSKGFEKKDKINIDDVPIIYDQNQLNIGLSPLFEDTNADHKVSDIIQDNFDPQIIKTQKIPTYINLANANNEVTLENIRKKSERPTTLEINKVGGKRKKVKVLEEPFFNKNQLKLGSSPIVEDGEQSTAEPAILATKCSNPIIMNKQIIKNN